MKSSFSQYKFELNGVMFKNREVSGFLLEELQYSPSTELLSHAHDQAMFCMAIEGGCSESYGAKTREYRPFTLGYLPQNQTHSIKTTGKGMRAFSIKITPQWLKRMSEYSLNVEDSVYCPGGILIQVMTRLYHEFQSIDEASPLAVEGLTLEMLAEVSRYQVMNKERKPPRWLKQARDIVHEQFSVNLSLDTIGREVGVHPVHLARAFRQHYSCSIGEYVRSVRIENACRRMITTDTPLIEIALATGFSDQSHFNRIFKRFIGVTPAQYRTEVNSC